MLRNGTKLATVKKTKVILNAIFRIGYQSLQAHRKT